MTAILSPACRQCFALRAPAITNFFQLSRETLIFQHSIFWHCENACKKHPQRVFFALKSCVSPTFCGNFHKGSFAVFLNPWHIRLCKGCWVFFPFVRDYSQFIAVHKGMIKNTGWPASIKKPSSGTFIAVIWYCSYLNSILLCVWSFIPPGFPLNDS